MHFGTIRQIGRQYFIRSRHLGLCITCGECVLLRQHSTGITRCFTVLMPVQYLTVRMRKHYFVHCLRDPLSLATALHTSSMPSMLRRLPNGSEVGGSFARSLCANVFTCTSSSCPVVKQSEENENGVQRAEAKDNVQPQHVTRRPSRKAEWSFEDSLQVSRTPGPRKGKALAVGRRSHVYRQNAASVDVDINILRGLQQDLQKRQFGRLNDHMILQIYPFRYIQFESFSLCGLIDGTMVAKGILVDNVPSRTLNRQEGRWR